MRPAGRTLAMSALSSLSVSLSQPVSLSLFLWFPHCLFVLSFFLFFLSLWLFRISSPFLCFESVFMLTCFLIVYLSNLEFLSSTLYVLSYFICFYVYPYRNFCIYSPSIYSLFSISVFHSFHFVSLMFLFFITIFLHFCPFYLVLYTLIGAIN